MRPGANSSSLGPDDRSRARFRHGDRRHPARRHDPAPPRSCRRGRAGAGRLLRGSLAPEPLSPLPRARPRGRPVPAHPRRSGLGREGRAHRRPGRRRRGADRRDRELREASRPAHGRSGVRRRRRLPGEGDRHAAPRAAGAPRLGARIEAFIAEVLAENRAMLSVFENVGFVPTRTLDDGVVEVRFPIAATTATRRAWTSATTSPSPPRCDRSSSRARSPSSAPRPRGLDRRAHLPEHPHRRIHRCGLPRESFRRARRRRPGLPLARRDRRSHRPLRRLPPRRARRRRRRGGAAHGTRALCVISAGFAETGPRGSSARSGFSPSSAPTARGSSARTASGSRAPPWA